MSKRAICSLLTFLLIVFNRLYTTAVPIMFRETRWEWALWPLWTCGIIPDGWMRDVDSLVAMTNDQDGNSFAAFSAAVALLFSFGWAAFSGIVYASMVCAVWGPCDRKEEPKHEAT